MANLLHFVRDLLQSDEEQLAYRDDRAGYVAARGMGDLSGEDVVEAVSVVRDLLEHDASERIDAATGTAPDPAPAPGEEPLDAALRLLDHHVAAVRGEDPGPDGSRDPEGHDDDPDHDRGDDGTDHSGHGA